MPKIFYSMKRSMKGVNAKLGSVCLFVAMATKNTHSCETSGEDSIGKTYCKCDAGEVSLGNL